MVARLPKTIKTGDWAEDARREGIRDDMAELLQVLWDEQDLVNPCLVYIRKLRERANQATDLFDPMPVSFSKIDKEFMVSWIVPLHKKFTFDFFDAMDLDDGEFVQHFFCAVLQLSPSLPVPKELGSKTVMTDFLAWRVAQVNRVAHMAKYVSDSGYNKQMGGPFQLTFDEAGVLKSVAHCSGETGEVPEDIRITKKFPLRHWFSDTCAALVLGPVTLVLKDLFPAGAGPNTGALTKQLAVKQAVELLKQHQDKERNAQPVDKAEVLKKSKEAAAERLADRARETLARHRQNREKKQKLTLT